MTQSRAAFAYPEAGGVRCGLCRQGCLLRPGQRGRCGVRLCAEENGLPVLHTLVADRVISAGADPVEKKPLYHYLPGSLTFSWCTEGCNFDCDWCQNDSISRRPAETGEIRGERVTPAYLVDAARNSRCASMAFTYTEPTIFFELMLESASLARQASLGTIMVSNGYQSVACLEALTPHIQAANIDLKSFREATYGKRCGGSLQGVLDNLRLMRRLGWWLEITTLIVPGVNDSPEEVQDIAAFIATELGSDTPWHIAAFRPCRRMAGARATPADTVRAAREIGQNAGLAYVYLGNLSGAEGRNTACPVCHTLLVTREGYGGRATNAFAQGHCQTCGTVIPGVWTL